MFSLPVRSCTVQKQHDVILKLPNYIENLSVAYKSMLVSIRLLGKI